MKLPFIEALSDNSINQFNPYDRRNLNNFKALKEIKNNSFNALNHNLDKDTLLIQCINLKKNGLKGRLKRISSVSDVESININKINMNPIKFIKIQKNKTLFDKIKSENNDNNIHQNLLKSDEYIPQLINNKLNLCHKPSLAIIVFLKSGLSAITKRTKNKSENAKDIADIIPTILFPFLNSRIDNSKGTNKNSIKPITEPKPCIFEAVVISSFVSLTLKKQVKIQAPTANITKKATTIITKDFDTLI